MELAEAVARHDERIESLEGYQKKQNGSLDKLTNRVEGVQEQIRGLYLWVMALLGGVAIQLALTILGAKK